MDTSKRLLLLLMVGFCVLGLEGAANASDQGASNQVCFKLESKPLVTYSVLKLGVMDYGNGHMSVAGSMTDYTDLGSPVNYPTLVNGNAELSGGYVHVFLNTASTLPDSTFFTSSGHLVLNPETLNGISYWVPGWEAAANGAQNNSGTVTVAECP